MLHHSIGLRLFRASRGLRWLYSSIHSSVNCFTCIDKNKRASILLRHAIELFDIAVLHRLAGLYVLYSYAAVIGQSSKSLMELSAIVQWMADGLPVVQ
jgi:hypothetical protein